MDAVVVGSGFRGSILAWEDTRRAGLTVGTLLDVPVIMGLGDAAALIASVEPVGAHGLVDRAVVVGKVAAGGLREAFRLCR